MSRKKNKLNELSPEEQVNLHLALRGGNDISEIVSANEQDDTVPDEDLPSPLEYVRRYLKRTAGTIHSVFELRIPSFVFNEFMFEETDPYRTWQLNTIMSDAVEPETEDVLLGFIRFTGALVETRNCRMSELPDEEQVSVGNIADHCFLELKLRSEVESVTDEDYEDEPFTCIHDVPIFSAQEYAEESHTVLDDRIRYLYEDIVEFLGDQLSSGDENISHIVPIESVYGVYADSDRSNPEMFEIVAVSKMRKTDQMVILGHPYHQRNSRQRRTEQVLPLELAPLGCSVGVLKELEIYKE